MIMQNTFSLIIATYGRYKEIDRLLHSFAQLEYDLNLLEIYIVDQNNKIDLQPIVEKYTSILHIHHIRSSRKGLSFNRNIGLKEAHGDIIAFPDDDCTYYPDTLKKVNKAFAEFTDASLLLGQIFDRKRGEKIIRNWSNHSFCVNLSNFYTNFSSITMFVKNDGKNRLFDERLGSGEYLGSCEDADYIVQALKNNYRICYAPEIQVWHPSQKNSEFSESKIASYGRGFGAFAHKNFNLQIAILFGKVIVYHTFRYIFFMIKGRKKEKTAEKISIISRINGWELYKKSKNKE